jgi:hypothetical protein
MRATCQHIPRRLVPNGAKRKDGLAQLVCADCKSAWGRRSNRKRNGFQALWDAQHGLCAFCSQPLADDNTTHRDHNHTTGVVRGLVHAQCNQMIGGIENAIALVGLDALVRYITG